MRGTSEKVVPFKVDDSVRLEIGTVAACDVSEVDVLCVVVLLIMFFMAVESWCWSLGSVAEVSTP